jgi:RimJ/RimL family protein N-acetyltransferase
MLHLAFAGLGAHVAETSAWHDNDASLGVTRTLGYEVNGWALELRRARAERHLRFLLTRERWDEHRRADIAVVGLEACLPSFGLGADLTPS